MNTRPSLLRAHPPYPPEGRVEDTHPQDSDLRACERVRNIERPGHIEATFKAIAPVLPGEPDPASRLKRFLKRLGRDYGIAIKWGDFEQSKSDATPTPPVGVGATAAPAARAKSPRTHGGGDGVAEAIPEPRRARFNLSGHDNATG